MDEKKRNNIDIRIIIMVFIWDEIQFYASFKDVAILKGFDRKYTQ